MIEKSNYGYKLICDICGYETDGFDAFQAVDYKKRTDGKAKSIMANGRIFVRMFERGN